MQISGSTYSTLPVPASYRRDELAQRRQNPRNSIDSTQQAQTSAPRGEITRIRTRADTQNAAAEVRTFPDTTGRNRSALQAYRSNGPTIEERLGVELAGVDVYA